jgi:hypothetical protein
MNLSGTAGELDIRKLSLPFLSLSLTQLLQPNSLLNLATIHPLWQQRARARKLVGQTKQKKKIMRIINSTPLTPYYSYPLLPSSLTLHSRSLCSKNVRSLGPRSILETRELRRRGGDELVLRWASRWTRSRMRLRFGFRVFSHCFRALIVFCILFCEFCILSSVVSHSCTNCILVYNLYYNHLSCLLSFMLSLVAFFFALF